LAVSLEHDVYPGSRGASRVTRERCADPAIGTPG
jgi:hypothetical protein